MPLLFRLYFSSFSEEAERRIMAKAYLVKLNTREDDDIWIDENIAVALTKEKAIEAINEDFKNRQWAELRECDEIYHVYSEITHFEKWYSIEEISLVN